MVGLNRQTISGAAPRAQAPGKVFKGSLLIGGLLGVGGCGSLEMDNYIPMPSQKDGGRTDSRRDGAVPRESGPDMRLSDANSDLKASMDKGRADAKASDKGPADGCVASKGALSCSNSFAAASGWLSLGQSMDLKGSQFPMSAVYRLRLDGVETKAGLTSAIIAVTDTCGTPIIKEKAPAGSTKSIVVMGQELDVTVDEVYGGLASGDSGVMTGWAKLTAKVPCNLDSGVADAKPADAKPAADSGPKADSKKPADAGQGDKAVAKDSTAAKDAAAQKDAGIKADSAPHADLKAPDSIIAKDSKSPDAAKPKDGAPAKDSKAQLGDGTKKDILSGDGMTSCAPASAGSFSGLILSGTPVTVGGYAFDYKGKKGIEAIFDISCGGSLLVAGAKCTVGSTTQVLLEHDGKTIEIYPVAAGTNVANVTITVVKN